MQEPGDLLSDVDGQVVLFRQFLTAEEARDAYETLLSSSPWRQEELTVFGRKVLTPRLSSWHGDAPYTYSGLTMPPEPWTPLLLMIKERTEAVSGASFNSVLLNLYRDGRDSMGWHSDDETELGVNPSIASVSLGEPRRFRLRHKTDKDKTLSIDLPDASLLLMSGPLQHHWQHAVPKTARKVGSRINLTFRWTSPPATTVHPEMPD